jgi:hypothetical protein
MKKLIFTVSMALVLSACGEEEKKVLEGKKLAEAKGVASLVMNGAAPPSDLSTRQGMLGIKELARMYSNSKNSGSLVAMTEGECSSSVQGSVTTMVCSMPNSSGTCGSNSYNFTKTELTFTIEGEGEDISMTFDQSSHVKGGSLDGKLSCKFDFTKLFEIFGTYSDSEFDESTAYDAFCESYSCTYEGAKIPCSSDLFSQEEVCSI